MKARTIGTIIGAVFDDGSFRSGEFALLVSSIWIKRAFAEWISHSISQ